jgi:hypothetical protein
LPVEFGEQQRVLAGLAELGEVVLHADLNSPAAGLSTSAFLISVRFAHASYRDIGYQGILAGCRQLAEMVPYAGQDPAVAGLDPSADLVEVFGTSTVRHVLLCGRSGWNQQEKYSNAELRGCACYGAFSHSSESPALRNPGK